MASGHGAVAGSAATTAGLASRDGRVASIATAVAADDGSTGRWETTRGNAVAFVIGRELYVGRAARSVCAA
jgi:hypothetical protein